MDNIYINRNHKCINIHNTFLEIIAGKFANHDFILFFASVDDQIEVPGFDFIANAFDLVTVHMSPLIQTSKTFQLMTI